METKVSFITTVRNGEKYISDTIESVLKQTLKNWEYIIVDDGSYDKTNEIINKFVSRDNRIKLIETRGIGRGNALNLAVEMSSSKYIANIDADDPCHPQRAEIQLDVMKKNKKISVLVTNSIYLKQNDNYDWKMYTRSQKIIVNDITISQQRPFYKVPINHSSTMFVKDDLVNIGMYDTTRNSQFDYELWIRLSVNSKKIGSIPLKLASKRIHPNQSFESKKNRRNYLKSSLQLKLLVIKKFNLPFKYYLFVYLSYCYGFLPQNFRKIIRNNILERSK